jgi:hypothetical protein
MAFKQIGENSVGNYGMAYAIFAVFSLCGVFLTHFHVDPYKQKSFWGCNKKHDLDDEYGFDDVLGRGDSEESFMTPPGGAYHDPSSPEDQNTQVHHMSPGFKSLGE